VGSYPDPSLGLPRSPTPPASPRGCGSSGGDWPSRREGREAPQRAHAVTCPDPAAPQKLDHLLGEARAQSGLQHPHVPCRPGPALGGLGGCQSLRHPPGLARRPSTPLSGKGRRTLATCRGEGGRRPPGTRGSGARRGRLPWSHHPFLVPGSRAAGTWPAPPPAGRHRQNRGDLPMWPGRHCHPRATE
jgi:hypothetical protein